MQNINKKTQSYIDRLCLQKTGVKNLNNYI